MSLEKITYVHEQTVISAEHLNAIQDEIIKNGNDIENLMEAAENGSAGTGVLHVTINMDVASHSTSEIRAAVDLGKAVIATLYGTILTFLGFQDNGANFALYGIEEYGTNIITITVREDKTCTATVSHAPNVVTVSVEESAASHTPGQIKTHAENGSLVVLRYDDRYYTLQQVKEDSALFSCARGPEGLGDANHIYTVAVLSDGTISTVHSSGGFVPVPGKEDMHKVLGATEYGFEWVDPSAGGYTEEEKAELVNAVLAALPIYAGEVETV